MLSPATAPETIAADLAKEIARWLAHLRSERRLSPNTLEAYDRDLRQCLVFLGEHWGGRVTLPRFANLRHQFGDIRIQCATLRGTGFFFQGTQPCLGGSDPSGVKGASQMEALVFSLFGVVVLGGLAAAVVWEVRHRVGSFKVNLTSARGTLETALHPADRVRVLRMLTSICLEHGTTEALGPLLDFLSKRIPRELSPGADGSPARGSPSPAPASARAAVASAIASATRRSERACFRGMTMSRRRALRCCSTSSIASARPSKRPKRD